VFFRLILAYSRIEVAGETDEPVTKDIKRLLRMPYSLHGKTGFKVVKVELEELKDFDPLDTPVIFSSKPVKVEITKPIQVKLKKEEFKLEPGETEVPLYAAVFLIGRRAAKMT
jgi:DNA primase small subunit